MSYQLIRQTVDALTERQVKDKLISLLQSIDPSSDCVCDSLDEKYHGERVGVCAGHSARLASIVFAARRIVEPPTCSRYALRREAMGLKRNAATRHPEVVQ